MPRLIFNIFSAFIASSALFCGGAAVALADGAPSPVVEGGAGAGVMASEQMFLDKAVAKSSGNFIPYGHIRLRFGAGKFLRPEIVAEDSGRFKFDVSGIRKGGGESAYNNYYVKIPLGIPVPFFHYRSSVAFDAGYSTMTTGLKLKKQALVNNNLYEGGEKFTAVSSEMTFRLYLNTPVVLEPDFLQYSYFGIFYSERVLPRTVSPPGGLDGAPDLVVSTVTRTGGIFYDMKKDTPLKGLGVEVAAYLGYGDMFKLEDVSAVGAGFGNTKELLTIYAKGGLGYRYIFSGNLGLDINAGVSYFVTTEFLSTADNSKYGVNMGGDLRYFASLSFVFGY